jgi:hypothetical protein
MKRMKSGIDGGDGNVEIEGFVEGFNKNVRGVFTNMMYTTSLGVLYEFHYRDIGHSYYNEISSWVQDFLFLPMEQMPLYINDSISCGLLSYKAVVSEMRLKNVWDLEVSIYQ